MRRILAQTAKELTQILRDKLALGLALVLPVHAAHPDGNGHLADRQRSPDRRAGSRRFARLARVDRRLPRIDHIPRRAFLAVDRQPEDGVHRRTWRARRSSFPSDFGRDMARGTNTPVQMLIDASDSNTARLIAGYATEITSAYNAKNAGGGTAPRPCRPPSGSGTTRAGRRRNSTARESSCSALSMFPPLAGRARHGEGRGAEDHPAGLCLQHLGA